MIAHVDFSSGLVRQWMSYDAFGVMKVLRPGDFDGSGVVNGDDWTAFNAAFVDPALAPLSCDIDFDGTVTGSDYDLFGQLWEECLATHPDEVRLGYAGYVRDPTTGLLLARHRWYDASVGRWITRDPAGYVDGLSLYLYARGNPFGLVDPMGLGGGSPTRKRMSALRRISTSTAILNTTSTVRTTRAATTTSTASATPSTENAARFIVTCTTRASSRERWCSRCTTTRPR